MRNGLFPLTIALALLFTQFANAVPYRKDSASDYLFSKNRIEVPVETNIHIGGLKNDDDDYPSGKNNFKPDPDDTVVPALQKEICVGVDCRCGDTGEK